VAHYCAPAQWLRTTALDHGYSPKNGFFYSFQILHCRHQTQKNISHAGWCWIIRKFLTGFFNSILYYIVGLPGFARDSYCQLCLFVLFLCCSISLYLCLFISLYLCLFISLPVSLSPLSLYLSLLSLFLSPLSLYLSLYLHLFKYWLEIPIIRL
jgi:hypothetical protein